MERPPRIYGADSKRRARILLPLACVLFIGAAIMQHVLDPQVAQYHSEEQNLAIVGTGLNNEFLLLPLLGFREAAAGLLWVRADEFFHSGDYDAILPLVRLITWLDPHDDTVYVTGAWHLAYNFTDTQERSDRRYIAPAMALLDEGIRNNMEIPDIKFEKGWECFDKVKDFIQAENAFKLAIATKPSIYLEDYPYGCPLKTLHMLAHTFERQGRIPEALDEWQKAMYRSADTLRHRPDDRPTAQLREAEEHNFEETLQRYRDRYTTFDHSAVNPTPYPEVLMPGAHQTKPTVWDVYFEPKIEVPRPQVFKITGLFNGADGARIGVWISDWGYRLRPFHGPLRRFDVDQSKTICIETISVKHGKFDREVDMSKDPKMYSFSARYYEIVLSFDPRTAPPHLQDRFGWSGEGMTDSIPGHVWFDQRNDLLGTKLIDHQGGTGPIWDGTTTPWPVHGQPPRLVKVTYRIDLDQVKGLKPITDKDIRPNDDAYTP